MASERDDLAAAVDRLADRLRALPLSRLGQLVDGRGGESRPRWRHALDLARQLAVLAQGAEERAAAEPPAWREPMPEAGPFAVGDQLVVAATDLALALPAEPADEVWTPQGRAPADEIVSRATALVHAAATRL